MKLKILILFLTILCFSTFSYSDVIEPGKKEVKIYYQITNINDYPDYYFFIHGSPTPQLEFINSSEFSFYKFSKVSIYAISKSSFNQKTASNWDSFKDNPELIKSNLILRDSSKAVNSYDPLDMMLITLKINSINNKNINISKLKVLYQYTNGKIQEETFNDQNIIPEPSANNSLTSNINLFYIILPLLATLGIVLILVKRSKN